MTMYPARHKALVFALAFQLLVTWVVWVQDACSASGCLGDAPVEIAVYIILMLAPVSFYGLSIYIRPKKYSRRYAIGLLLVCIAGPLLCSLCGYYAQAAIQERECRQFCNEIMEHMRNAGR